MNHMGTLTSVQLHLSIQPTLMNQHEHLQQFNLQQPVSYPGTPFAPYMHQCHGPFCQFASVASLAPFFYYDRF